MRIDKLTIKTGAGVVLLRERKEQFARAYRTRVDGIISNLFVKHLGADARRIRAHQSCCLAKVHVITASSKLHHTTQVHRSNHLVGDDVVPGGLIAGCVVVFCSQQCRSLRHLQEFLHLMSGSYSLSLSFGTFYCNLPKST